MFDYNNVLRFWKNTESINEKNTGSKPLEKNPAREKVSKKAQEVLAEKEKEAERPGKVGKLIGLFESAQELQPKNKPAPRKIAIPSAFLKDAVLPQQNVKKEAKDKEKEIEIAADEMEEKFADEKKFLKEIEQKVHELNRKLDENPSLKDLNLISKEYLHYANILGTDEFNLPLDHLLGLFIRLRKKIDRAMHLTDLWRYQPDQLATEENFKKLTNTELFEQLEILKETLLTVSELKSNDPKFYAEFEKRINENLATIQKIDEANLFDLRSIEEDIAKLRQRNQIIVSSAGKISSRQIKGLTHSYTIYPDGTIFVHLKKKEKVRIGGEIKKGLLGKGGIKKAKLRQNIDTGIFDVRGILTRLDPKQREILLSFLKDMKGEKHVCQMEHMAWRTKPKKDPKDPFSVFRNKKVVVKDAFTSDYYPFTGDKLIPFIKKEEVSKQLQVSLALQMAQGVQPIHNKRWVHRDLNPDNFLFQWDPSNPEKALAVVADFDFVHKVEDLDSTTKIRGTPGFIAPEYAYPENIKDARPADVYALGVSYFEMFISHGTAPWKGDRKGNKLIFLLAKGKYAKAIEKLKENAQTPFEHLIMDMLQTNPDARPTMDQVVERLQGMDAQSI